MAQQVLRERLTHTLMIAPQRKRWQSGPAVGLTSAAHAVVVAMAVAGAGCAALPPTPIFPASYHTVQVRLWVRHYLLGAGWPVLAFGGMPAPSSLPPAV
jgi:hypothetical protein